MEVAVAEKGLLDKNALEKCNVAWFKLAEFVGRKEKERALGVYRLLAHSLPDEAFAAQLEGDLLMAFCDKKAFDAYTKAARLYEKNGKIYHAVCVYDYMLQVKPQAKDFWFNALRLYEIIKSESKIALCQAQLALLVRDE